MKTETLNFYFLMSKKIKMPDASTGDESGTSFASQVAITRTDTGYVEISQYIPVQDRIVRYTPKEAAKLGLTVYCVKVPELTPQQIARNEANRAKLESERKRGWTRDGTSYFKKDANRYANGKIYKLIHQGKCIYVGSTIRDLDTRLSGHRNSAKAGTSPIYKFMRDVGPDTLTIELLEAFPCKSKCQLIRREMEQIHKHRCEALLNVTTICS